MGIKDLYRVIEDHAPDQIVTGCSLSDLRGQAIAIDMSIYLYRYILSFREERAWVDALIQLVTLLKKHRIKAVCVFDGPSPPLEKQEEQQARRLARTKTVLRIQALRDALRGVEATPREDVGALYAKKDELRRLMCRNPRTDALDYRNYDDVLLGLEEKIEALSRQTRSITSEHTAQAIALINAMGVAAMQARGEAEKLCAYLACQGRVLGVLTEDTDVLAYGCPVMLSKLDVTRGTVSMIGYRPLLADLCMTPAQFLDLCILLQCDYNHRAKLVGKKGPVPIGRKRAFALMEEHGSLEAIVPKLDDPAPLNIARCRELFSFDGTDWATPEERTACTPYNGPVDRDALQALMDTHGCQTTMEHVLHAFAPTPVIVKELETGVKNMKL